jgi:hypothetical protein
MPPLLDLFDGKFPDPQQKRPYRAKQRQNRAAYYLAPDFFHPLGCPAAVCEKFAQFWPNFLPCGMVGGVLLGADFVGHVM